MELFPTEAWAGTTRDDIEIQVNREHLLDELQDETAAQRRLIADLEAAVEEGRLLRKGLALYNSIARWCIDTWCQENPKDSRMERALAALEEQWDLLDMSGVGYGPKDSV